MKAIVYEKPGRANGALREIPKPEPREDEVLIRVMACSICKPAESSHDRNGSVLGEYPAIPGHEFAGIVEKVGKGVNNVSQGDHVTADNAYFCGVCHNCQSGRPTMCTHYRAQGHNMPGGFAEYIVCRADHVYRLPPEMSFDAACLCELINCCDSCVRHSELSYGETAVILGAGSSGNILAQLFCHSSAGSVCVLDCLSSKLKRLEPYGVKTVLVDERQPEKAIAALEEMYPEGIDILVDAVGDNGEMLEQMMSLLAPGGRLMLYSFFYNEPKTFRVSPGLMIRKGLKIVSAPLQTHSFGECVKILAEKKVDTSKLISRTYPLDQYFEAMDAVMHDQELLKVVIHPDQNDRSNIKEVEEIIV